ncbi:MAG: hypothetical protein WAL12_25675 [Trebonia sp.]
MLSSVTRPWRGDHEAGLRPACPRVESIRDVPDCYEVTGRVATKTATGSGATRGRLGLDRR